jgi:hypothetical protein
MKKKWCYICHVLFPKRRNNAENEGWMGPSDFRVDTSYRLLVSAPSLMHYGSGWGADDVREPRSPLEARSAAFLNILSFDI